jgi:phosphoribosylaminoimidazolecarboxamide formyltransferase/IMP cyclohydrolase
LRSITGGFLIQDDDADLDQVDGWRIVTQSQPSGETMAELQFAWDVSRSVRSNAIVLSRERALVGVGPGQPNRLDSVRLAIQRAGPRAAGAVLASDAFFPFADGVDLALSEGVIAVVQPGGSVRDAEVIESCDRAGVPMVFTGTRHFLH